MLFKLGTKDSWNEINLEIFHLLINHESYHETLPNDYETRNELSEDYNLNSFETKN